MTAIPDTPDEAVKPPIPHPTILRRAVLLCADSTPHRVVRINPETGICPKHRNGACALWFVPWPDAERAAKEARRAV